MDLPVMAREQTAELRGDCQLRCRLSVSLLDTPGS